MGCNFYIRIVGGFPLVKHIGKRSAAGLYCWDCKRTLCVAGEKGVHLSCERYNWLEKCPVCKNPRTPEEFEETSGGRELGCIERCWKKKSGVKSCASFTWAIHQAELKLLLLNPFACIKDDYGRFYGNDEFLEGVLGECPIRFFKIGRDFD